MDDMIFEDRHTKVGNVNSRYWSTGPDSSRFRRRGGCGENGRRQTSRCGSSGPFTADRQTRRIQRDRA